jgi:hypothetical protein
LILLKRKTEKTGYADLPQANNLNMHPKSLTGSALSLDDPGPLGGFQDSPGAYSTRQQGPKAGAAWKKTS